MMRMACQPPRYLGIGMNNDTDSNLVKVDVGALDLWTTDDYPVGSLKKHLDAKLMRAVTEYFVLT